MPPNPCAEGGSAQTSRFKITKTWEEPILFARTGATTGKTHLVRDVEKAVFASYLIRLRPKTAVLSEYLYSFFQSNHYWAQIIDEKEGSAQPNVNGKKLAAVKIPSAAKELQGAISNFLEAVRARQDGTVEPLPELPPTLSKARRIVRRIEELVAKVEEARGLRSQTIKAEEILIRTSIRETLSHFPVNGHFGDILTGKPRNGWSARCDNAEGGTPVLSLGAVTGFTYRSTEFKKTSEATVQGAHYWLQPGDLLITRSNTPELVGHAAIYDGSPNPCIYPDLMMRLDVDEEKASKKFVHYWLRSSQVRDFITSAAKGTSPTMKKISQETVMKIPFPSSMSLLQQQEVVDHLDTLHTKISKLRKLQEQTATELNALLPSILDKAFKGEL